mmetsp:Transcript_100188/g.259032  ORF Transcript_100188/g.259032 Transcript_100188/m.259032 type:complete len:204 (+) Transcript_100188:119-730(+)
MACLRHEDIVHHHEKHPCARGREGRDLPWHITRFRSGPGRQRYLRGLPAEVEAAERVGGKTETAGLRRGPGLPHGPPGVLPSARCRGDPRRRRGRPAHIRGRPLRGPSFRLGHRPQRRGCICRSRGHAAFGEGLLLLLGLGPHAAPSAEAREPRQQQPSWRGPHAGCRRPLCVEPAAGRAAHRAAGCFWALVHAHHSGLRPDS